MKSIIAEKTTYELHLIVKGIYKKCDFEISNYFLEKESQEYDACQFNLNDLKIISRTAKITPKKVGQFVTFWKRKTNQPIAPFDDTDDFDFFVVNLQNEKRMGQFVFPKSILIQKGIVSTSKKEGKRAFRVYPPWDITENKQAVKSQKWQVEYFYEIDDNFDFNTIIALYGN